LPFAALLACTRPQPVDVATPDPSANTFPSQPSTPTPMPTPTQPAPISIPSWMSKTPEPVGERVCEPIVQCGVWSECVWLQRVDQVRYRVIGGDAEKGSIFVRRHQCSGDAGTADCAIHCGGVDAGPPCVDGLHPEHEVCDKSAAPRPDAKRCLPLAGTCGSLM
jgi:hypothetical protein